MPGSRLKTQQMQQTQWAQPADMPSLHTPLTAAGVTMADSLVSLHTGPRSPSLALASASIPILLVLPITHCTSLPKRPHFQQLKTLGILALRAHNSVGVARTLSGRAGQAHERPACMRQAAPHAKGPSLSETLSNSTPRHLSSTSPCSSCADCRDFASYHLPISPHPHTSTPLLHSPAQQLPVNIFRKHLGPRALRRLRQQPCHGILGARPAPVRVLARAQKAHCAARFHEQVPDMLRAADSGEMAARQGCLAQLRAPGGSEHLALVWCIARGQTTPPTSPSHERAVSHPQ
jgi:hypothetical protein